MKLPLHAWLLATQLKIQAHGIQLAGSRAVATKSTVPATSIHQGEEGRGVAFERTGGAPSRREYAYRR
jgi:hypothetical protein